MSNVADRDDVQEPVNRQPGPALALLTASGLPFDLAFVVGDLSNFLFWIEPTDLTVDPKDRTKARTHIDMLNTADLPIYAATKNLMVVAGTEKKTATLAALLDGLPTGDGRPQLKISRLCTDRPTAKKLIAAKRAERRISS